MELTQCVMVLSRVCKCQEWPSVFRWNRFNSNSCRWPRACRKLCQDNRSEIPLPPMSLCLESYKKQQTYSYIQTVNYCTNTAPPQLRTLERAHMLTNHIRFTASTHSQPQRSSLSQKSGFQKNGSSISESREFIHAKEHWKKPKVMSSNSFFSSTSSPNPKDIWFTIQWCKTQKRSKSTHLRSWNKQWLIN